MGETTSGRPANRICGALTDRGTVCNTWAYHGRHGRCRHHQGQERITAQLIRFPVERAQQPETEQRAEPGIDAPPWFSPEQAERYCGDRRQSITVN